MTNIRRDIREAFDPNRPPSARLIALFRGERGNDADHFGCGLMGAGPCGIDCAAFGRSHVGRVPRALTDVQRRGGRGTP